MADAAVQLHYGDRIPNDRLRHSYYSPNSIIKLSVNIKGEADLQIRGGHQLNRLLIPRSFCVSNPPGGVRMFNAYETQHGIEYPQSPWRNRVITLQLRMLMSANDAKIVQAATTAELCAVVSAVTSALQLSPLRMPSIEAVQNIAAKGRNPSPASLLTKAPHEPEVNSSTSSSNA